MRYFIGFLSIALIGSCGYWGYQNFLYWSGSYQKPESFNELVENWAELDNIPGVILHITQDLQPVYSGSKGNLSLKSEQNIDATTHFHTASTGKIFTTIAVLRLHEQGVLSLDEPVRPYIDEKILSRLVVIDEVDLSFDITFRDLLTHRAGLPNSDSSLSFQYYVLSNLNRNRSPEELINFARKMSPVGRPGENIQYSSIGYMLVGLALEGVTGQPYHSVIRQQLLNPLELKNTYESNYELPKALETTHHYFGYIDLANADPSFEFADGGFVTTAQDLAQLGHAILQGDVFQSKETEELFFEPLSDSAGFGFYWGTSENGSRYFFQPGFWGVRFIVFPDHQLVATFTLNQSNTTAQKFLRQLVALLDEQGLLSEATKAPG